MKSTTLPLALTAALFAGTVSSRNLQSAQVDSSFTTRVNGTVHAISVDPSGAILIGGDFAEVNGTAARNLAKLSRNGALDYSSNFATDGAVLAMSAHADGILIAGAFNSPNAHITRLLSDGTFDALPIGSSTSSRIDCLAVGADNTIHIGGPFRRLNSASSVYAARLNSTGAIDSDFTPSFLPSMSIEAGADAIAVQSDGKVIVGGNFNTAEGFATLVRLNNDGSQDSSFAADHGAILYPKVIQILENGKIIIAGVADSSGAGFVRRLNDDGTIDTTFTEATFNGCVDAIALGLDGSLLVGGSFSGGLARLNRDGSSDDSWNITTDGLVKTIAFQGEDAAIVAGTFTKIANHSSVGVARVSFRQALLATNSNGRFNAHLNGETGKTYEIEASADLSNWTVLGTAVATDGRIAVQDNMAGSKTHRFFRARLIN